MLRAPQLGGSGAGDPEQLLLIFDAAGLWWSSGTTAGSGAAALQTAVVAAPEQLQLPQHPPSHAGSDPQRDAALSFRFPVSPAEVGGACLTSRSLCGLPGFASRPESVSGRRSS